MAFKKIKQIDEFGMNKFFIISDHMKVEYLKTRYKLPKDVGFILVETYDKTPLTNWYSIDGIKYIEFWSK